MKTKIDTGGILRQIAFMRYILLFFLLSACATIAPKTSPISLENFDDAVHHWQMGHTAPYARYEPSQIREIGDNILLLQRNNGGWVQNLDPARILTDADKAKYRAEKSINGASFDNRNIYSQIEYLMNVFTQTREDKYKISAIAGINFTLAQQMPICGGWPHTINAGQTYQGRLTIADEVFSGNLQLLRKITAKRPPFAFIDPELQHRASLALQKGDECLLRLQIRQNGALTGWAGQYDPQSLAPMGGRKFELTAIVSQETVEILRYLMSIENPSAAQIAAIEGGVNWLKSSAISGQRIETFDAGESTQFDHHATRQDRRLIIDADAPLLWARFYDIADNSIVLATREGIRVANYHEIPRERRTGYSWYGSWPQSLLSVEYPNWRARNTAQ